MAIPERKVVHVWTASICPMRKIAPGLVVFSHLSNSRNRQIADISTEMVAQVAC